MCSTCQFTGITKNVCACILSQSCPTLCDPWAVAHQTPLSMEFSRQEYWGGLPFPLPEDLHHPVMKPTSLVSLALTGKFLSLHLLGSPTRNVSHTPVLLKFCKPPFLTAFMLLSWFSGRKGEGECIIHLKKMFTKEMPKFKTPFLTLQP